MMGSLYNYTDVHCTGVQFGVPATAKTIRRVLHPAMQVKLASQCLRGICKKDQCSDHRICRYTDAAICCRQFHTYEE